MLSVAIYNNDHEQVNRLVNKEGIKPNKDHLKLIFEIQQKGEFVNPEIEKTINLNLPSQSRGISL